MTLRRDASALGFDIVRLPVPTMTACGRMQSRFRSIALLALLLFAQQGAIVHELGHLTAQLRAATEVGPGHRADTACALCPVYAQAVTPACSHPYPIPPLAPRTSDRTSAPDHPAAGTAAPRPRSRDPPAFG
jgi:hypothetical protein